MERRQRYISLGAEFAIRQMCVEPSRSHSLVGRKELKISQRACSAKGEYRLYLSLRQSLATSKEVKTIEPGQTV